MNRCVGSSSFITTVHHLISILFVTLLYGAIINGCGAFHPLIINRNRQPQLLALPLSNSKFPGIMAAEVEVSSSPSNGVFETLTWHDDSTAVLPDDELPPDIDAPPIMHNRRTLYYEQSLLSIDEATSLQFSAEQFGTFIESNQIAGIIEDGVVIAASLASILDPILASKILPWARTVSSTPTLTVADALIRTYDPSQECLHLSEHYDEAAFATVIIPLNDPNEYEGVSYKKKCA